MVEANKKEIMNILYSDDSANWVGDCIVTKVDNAYLNVVSQDGDVIYCENCIHFERFIGPHGFVYVAVGGLRIAENGNITLKAYQYTSEFELITCQSIRTSINSDNVVDLGGKLVRLPSLFQLNWRLTNNAELARCVSNEAGITHVNHSLHTNSTVQIRKSGGMRFSMI